MTREQNRHIARVQETVVKLRAALKAAPFDPELVEARDLLAEHLLRWAEDENDIADSRLDAVHAIRILSSELPASTRAAAADRLLALHDTPRFNQMDQMHQESLHPLSRFKFGSGIPWFSADCLFAAAALAETTDQRNAVWSRIADRLTDPEMSKDVAVSIGRAARTLSEIQAIDVRGLAHHPQPPLRQTAVICWLNDPDRDPDYAARFAGDDNWVVRANLARAIRRLEPQADVYAPLVKQLTSGFRLCGG